MAGQELELDGFARAVEQFEGAGLPVPPIPEALRGRLRAIGDWSFSTRDISAMSMYLFDEYPLEALTGGALDYVAFSHAGQGVNSYAINYHLVSSSLAVFVQSPWGGVYADGKVDVERLRDLFDRCAASIEAHSKAVERGALKTPGRLVVCESGFRDIARWAWLDEPMPTRTAARDWLDGKRNLKGSQIIAGAPPTLAAMNWLRELQA